MMAVDIGGTKTLVALFDDAGQITKKIKFPTPTDYQQFLRDLSASVSQLSAGSVEKTVVAVPGTIDDNHGLVTELGRLPWHNVAVQADIKNVVNSDVLIENDAKLGALSEAKALGDKYQKVLYLTISTGIGVGLIVNGKIDTATNDLGGHVIMIEKDGQEVSWESLASGKTIVDKYGKLASELDDPAAWQEVTHNMALGIKQLLEILSPDVIVIGGGVGASFNKFGDLLKKEIPEVPILPAQHPEEAVIYGCYEYGKQN